jgi:type 2 lantibiotic biosynthesis protein LanM
MTMHAPDPASELHGALTTADVPTTPAMPPWRSIAARSRHIYERLAATPGAIAPEANDSDARTFADAMSEWREFATGSDPDGFAQRLAADGLDEARLRPLWTSAAARDLPVDAPLPDWCALLQDAYATPPHPDDVAPPPGDASRHPFHVLLQPLVRTTVARLAAALDPALHPLLPAATCDNAPTLLRQLCHMAAKALHLSFARRLHREESALSRVLRQARGERSDRVHRAFVDDFRAGGWIDFFVEYPVLARQLGESCERWIAVVHEMLQRWQADRDALRETFPDIAEDIPQAFSLGQSDRHNGGRTTAIVRFASGQRLVYKPKPLQSDALMAALLAWIESLPDSLPIHHATTLVRADYGWQAWVEHRPCESVAGFERFHERIGYLLALTYALESYDYHHENLIADGEVPVLVDTETLFNPHREMARAGSGEFDAATLAAKTVFYSVLRTGFLPNWTVRDNGTRQDLSGLGGEHDDNDPFVVPRWIDAGTDDMRLEPVREAVKPRGNRPFLADGTRADAAQHVDALRRGFAHVYRGLLSRRREFLDLLQAHGRMPVRFVRKATRIYAEQLEFNLRPERLRDGLRWSLGVERQSRQFIAIGADTPGVWDLLRAEYDALMAMDVPWFRVSAQSRSIEDAAGRAVVPDYFDRDCLAHLEDKIALLDAHDLALQDRYIASSFHARAARSIHSLDPTIALADPQRQDTSTHPEADPARCLAAARSIAEALQREALEAPDGSLSWVALEYLRETDVFQLKPISYNLYSGSMGVAVFFAALGAATGDATQTDIAHRIAWPLQRIMREEPAQVARLSGLGVGVGLGSLVYGLTTLAALDHDAARAEACRALAADCALRIDDRTIAQDDKYDLIFGSAGALLALDRLMRALVDAQASAARIDAVRDRVRALVAHLHAAAARHDGLVPTYAGRAVTGLSHGSAGIALALARAARWTGEAAHADLALAHARFEEALCDPHEGHYPDYRSLPDRPSRMTTWCHGAPGIGLSRMKHHAVDGEPWLQEAARRDMATTHRHTLSHLDHTCCGTLGRLDIQWEFACVHGDDAARRALLRDLDAVLDEHDRLGGFRLFLNAPTQAFSPGLFTGASGIAYTLLRFAMPGRLPCVLAFD